jgi:hypothetical protein
LAPSMSDPSMHPELLFALPFLFLLLAVLLHIDARLTRPRRKCPLAPALGSDESGRTFFRDPDGSRWYPPSNS